MKKLFFLIGLFISLAAFSAELEHGNNYTHIDVQGNVTASCDSGTRTHYCYAYGLNPAMYTRIVKNSSLEADRFSINALHENGKSSTKKGKMKGDYSKDINLWIRTLLQKPLLAMGTNQVTIKLFNNGEVVSTDEINVEVARGQRKTCRRAYIRMFGNDCENTTRACDEYFRRGYCRN